MCRVWYQTHPSGQVDRQKFNKYATDFLKLPPGAEEHIDRMFGLIDQNNDGVLSFAELSLALATLARGTSEEKLELGFRLNDLNGDGFISGEEVWKAVHVLWLSGGGKGATNLLSGEGNALVQQFLHVAGARPPPPMTCCQARGMLPLVQQFLLAAGARPDTHRHILSRTRLLPRILCMPVRAPRILCETLGAGQLTLAIHGADTDGDQRISMDEYKAAAMRDEKFVTRML